jgi:DNA mismatch repair protein MutL
MEIRDEISRLGFEVEPFGSQALIINGVPAGMVHFNEKEIFEELIEQYKLNRDKLNLDKQENLARSISRYAASRYGKMLSDEERRMLIDQLFGCSNPNYSPSGEAVYSVVTINQLENLLKKKT